MPWLRATEHSLAFRDRPRIDRARLPARATDVVEGELPLAGSLDDRKWRVACHHAVVDMQALA
jgi:hypothetical protein